MSSDIDAIRGYNPPSGAGSFLKLNDSETAKVRITSLPVIFQNEFKMGDEVTLSTRFAFIVWNHDAERAQIWQTNGATYGQQLSPLLEDDEYGDWREYDVKISRSGEKAQTRYTIRPGIKRYELTDEQLNAVNSIDIVSVLDKSDNASQVMWLSEWRELEDSAKKKSDGIVEESTKKMSGYDQAKEAQKVILSKEELVIEDIGDEPINLDDIPF